MVGGGLSREINLYVGVSESKRNNSGTLERIARTGKEREKFM